MFGDLAARGRSLGLHLILCTQRPAGVIRDAVLANTTLRLSLRVTDRADSMAMLGGDAAARLPAEPRGRGIALIDGIPRTMQFAITEPSDAERIAASAPPATVGRPWCEPLPLSLSLDSLPAAPAGLAFGLVDLPAEQRQPVAAHDPERHGHLLVIGAGGAGSTTALATIAASAGGVGMRVVNVPPEPADAWEVLARETERPASGARTLLIIDDLDALIARFEPDYRHEFLELLTGLARGEGSGPALVVGARRLSGQLSGIAGVFGSRLLLRQTSREDHVLAGGDPRGFDPDLPPGSGTWRGAVVQVAIAASAPMRDSDVPLRSMEVDPRRHPVLAVVAGRPRALLAGLRASGARIVELGVDGGMAARDLLAPTPAPGTTPPPTAPPPTAPPAQGPTVVIGDPEAWLADWALLSAARRDWPIMLIGCTVADHRALLRDRTLPPPLGTAPGECWLSVDGRTTRAVLGLPDITRESEDFRPRNR